MITLKLTSSCLSLQFINNVGSLITQSSFYPFSVFIEDSAINGADNVDFLFFNDGGQLSIRNLTVTGATNVNGLIYTSGTTGTLRLESVDVSMSSIGVRVYIRKLDNVFLLSHGCTLYRLL